MPGIGRWIQGPFASDTPKQTPRQSTTTDPTSLYPGEREHIRDTIFNKDYLNRAQPQSISPGGPTYQGPRPEQQQVMASMAANTRATEPLFATGVGELKKTAEGGYTDVASQPGFKTLASTREATARDLFGDLSNDINSRAAVRGNYDSSTRLNQRNRAAGRVANQAAQDIAQAGWGQYAQERGYQDAASRTGTQLNPALNQALFGEGETLRSAQQQAAQSDADRGIRAQIAEAEAYLRAQGLNQNAIDQMLNYLRTVSGQALPSVVGPSDVETNREGLKAEASAASSAMGAFGGGGGGGGGARSMSLGGV